LEFADRPEPWIARRAALTPGAPALAWPGGALDYAALYARAASLADRLSVVGVVPGALVAVHHSGGASFAVLVHALQIRGATLLPLNTRLTRAEVGYQLRHSGAEILLVAGEAGVDLARSLSPDMPGLTSAALRGDAEGRDGLQILTAGTPASAPVEAADPPLALLYTSGTTGRPRAAALPASAFLHSARSAALLLGADAADRWLACMPLFHVGGLSILFRCVLVGSCVTVQDGFDSEAVSNALEREGITHVSLVAAMLRRILETRNDARAPAALRCVLLGGGPAPAPLLERARALGYPIAPTYGLTEAASQVATRPPGEIGAPHAERLRPLPGVELRIVDEGGVAVKTGDAGEILVRGPNVMRGYWRDPEATALALRGGWLWTGDIGRLDEDGALCVLDRRSDLILSGGENVYPAEVEAVLLGHPGVAECAVVGAPDPEFGERPVAFVVLDETTDAPEPNALHAHCEPRLAGYKRPLRFEIVDTLPRTAAGKVRRADLRESLRVEDGRSST
jgi:O-succinylbenzoic acid--CoA ligase